MIKIRAFNSCVPSSDVDDLWLLKFNTIRKINSKDYTQTQINAWAPDEYDHQNWLNRLSEMDPLIAEIDDLIVGFADLQADGYIDHFFCHLDYQGKGVGKALMQALIDKGTLMGLKRYYSNVSITAKPFFKHFGFIIVKQQSVAVRGTVLTNFLMEKSVSK